MAQLKSKIKSVEPRILNNVHYTYQMRGKTYYEYIVEMEDGNKGRASGIQNTFRFKAGDEVFYELVKDEQHGDRLKSFTATQAAKPPESPPLPTETSPEQQRVARFKEDPHKQHLIVAQSCLGSAVEWCAAKENGVSTKDVLKIATAFEDWVYKYESRQAKK